MSSRLWRILFVTLALFLALALAWNLPVVQEKLGWRLESALAWARQKLNPPQEAVFLPSGLPTPVIHRTAAPSPQISAQPTILPTLAPPTATLPPVPPRTDLRGAKVYTDQKNRWNYCGPANLVMALKFWGWKGLPGSTLDLRDQVAQVIKPGFNDPKKDFIARGRLDLNVMPYELVDFVNDETEFAALARFGGDMTLLKRLLAAGFPAIIEKGYYEFDTQGKRTWMGHYLFVTGYDETSGVFIVQDAYYLDTQKPRKDEQVKYADFLSGWRSFNYLLLLVYPPERAAELEAVLGSWNDPAWANQRALETAEADILSTQKIDLFFAWFNKGTSLVQLQQYDLAAPAYDEAFRLYASLPQDENYRPWRMVWYQTGPYWAYFYTGRYADVVALANVTLSTPSTGPTLEESLYWRGMAEWALGDLAAAQADMRESVRLNPHFAPGLQRLQEWGLQP